MPEEAIGCLPNRDPTALFEYFVVLDPIWTFANRNAKELGWDPVVWYASIYRYFTST